MTRSARRGARDGFTLIEVLAAFTIVSLFAVVLSRGLVLARAGAAVTEDTVAAEHVARSLIEGPIPEKLAVPGRVTGSAAGRSWTMVTEPVGLPLPEPKEENGKPVYAPLRVTVTVAVDARRSLSVEAVRLLKAPQ